MAADGTLTLNDDRCAFALVTRVRNPDNEGFVTVIACDYFAPAIHRIVEMLTSNEECGELLKAAAWPKPPRLPSSFEMLFKVGVAPDSMRTQGKPELICSAMYDTP